MTPLESAILGIVEGITEFLPVSSTAHLLVTQRLMGIPDSDASKAYAICIQAGAIVAVLGLYRRRVGQVFAGALGRDAQGRQLLINLAAAFIPAAVLGLLFEKRIDALLQSTWYVVAAWFVGGVVILAVARQRALAATSAGEATSQPGAAGGELTDLPWKLAMVIGFAQCIAMWPGVSRSLVTIVGGVLVGMRLAAAVEFSFLLGVLTLGGAAGYKGIKYGPLLLETYGPASLAIGFLFAFISAVVAIKWMVAYLNKHGMHLFGYYRVALAVIVAAMLLTKVVAA